MPCLPLPFCLCPSACRPGAAGAVPGLHSGLSKQLHCYGSGLCQLRGGAPGQVAVLPPVRPLIDSSHTFGPPLACRRGGFWRPARCTSVASPDPPALPPGLQALCTGYARLRGAQPSAGEKGMLGGMAAVGVMATTMPLENVMRRLQVQGRPGFPRLYSGPLDCAAKVGRGGRGPCVAGCRGWLGGVAGRLAGTGALGSGKQARRCVVLCHNRGTTPGLPHCLPGVQMLRQEGVASLWRGSLGSFAKVAPSIAATRRAACLLCPTQPTAPPPCLARSTHRSHASTCPSACLQAAVRILRGAPRHRRRAAVPCGRVRAGGTAVLRWRIGRSPFLEWVPPQLTSSDLSRTRPLALFLLSVDRIGQPCCCLHVSPANTSIFSCDGGVLV